MSKLRGGKQENKICFKGISKSSSKYELVKHQIELEAGQDKINGFHAYQHETLDQSSRQSSWDEELSFKTWFNHIMQGFINLRIAD